MGALCLFAFLLSLTDGLLTCLIGFELNPLLMQLSGPELIATKLFIGPLFLALFVAAPHCRLARVAVPAFAAIFGGLVSAELFALLVLNG